MATLFDAGFIVVSHEDEVLLVGLADHEFNTQSYVLLQRADAFDEQDRALGMDTVYIERDNQAQSAYGGIEQITVMPTRVVFVFTAATAQHLASDNELVVNIQPTQPQLQLLVTGLQDYCQGLVRLIITPEAQAYLHS